jgi:hypothetical protein
MEAGRFAAGSGRGGANPSRLDPFSLPVRFTAADDAADERLRVVDLHRERVVLRRSVRGIRMALNMPVASYRGVAIRLSGETGKTPTAIAVVLEHRDPALSLPLFASAERDDIVAWARYASKPRPGAAAVAAPSPNADLLACCAAAPASCRQRRSCIAANARSSQGIKARIWSTTFPWRGKVRRRPST